MITTTTLKKKILGFKPALHWKMILFFGLFLMVCAGVYATYLYFYAKKQIEVDIFAISQSTQAATTSPELKSLTSTEQMNVLFGVYENRDKSYQGILQKLISGKVASKVVSTSTASTTSVASSSKQ